MSTTQISQQNLDPNVAISTTRLEAPAKSQASEGDKAMYRGMMALLSSIGRSEEVGASLADLSKTLYDTVVTNGAKRVQGLQDELEFLNVFLEGFEQYRQYAKWEDRITYIKNRMGELEAQYKTKGYKEYESLKSELEKKENNPPAIPEKFRDRKDQLLQLSKTYERISGARAHVNSVSQQLSSENQIVSSNKQLPDGIQSQVKTMLLEQGVLAGQVMSFIRIIQRQLQHG